MAVTIFNNYCTEMYNVLSHGLKCLKYQYAPLAGLQEVGAAPRRGAAAARAEHDARSAVLPQLRPDLVRLHAARGRPHQDQVLGPLAGAHQGPRTTLKLKVSSHFHTLIKGCK